MPAILAHPETTRDRSRANPKDLRPSAVSAAPPLAPGDGCRLLLIADDERALAGLRAALGDGLVIDQLLGQNGGRRLRFDLDSVLLGRDQHQALRGPYHLAIVATTQVSPLAAMAAEPLLRAACAATLYLIGGGFTAALPDHVRRASDGVLAAPCSSQALRAEVERLLLTVLATIPAPVDDAGCLAFLAGLIARGQRVVQPLLTAGSVGPSYPLAAEHFGPGIDQAAILDRLAGLGLLSRSAVQRVRICPLCASHQLAWSEACVRCGSPDFVRATMIHHLTCGHRDTRAAFVRGERLVCPKCGWLLRQPGRDHESADDCSCCASCHTFATRTQASARCLRCQTVSAPQEVGELVLHTYALTAKADAAVRADDLGGQHMAQVLRNHETGLYPASFFLFTLDRELDRRRQHATPVAVVAVRAGFLERLRLSSGERYADQVLAVWRAATAGLSTLDIPCVWDEGVVLILLPDSGLDEADAQIRRIQDAFVAAGHDLDDAPLALTAVAADDSHADAEALVRDALDRLAGGGALISDVLVVEDADEVPVAMRA